jgi:ABC-2 type transport system ATP-binding protein
MTNIQINNLTKKFGEQVVLRNISMDLTSGNIYGFVGRNGSGKTMLMKHILGFVHPTEGEITVNGKVIGKDIDVLEDVGAIIENPGFLSEFSGFKNLELLAGIKKIIGKEEIAAAMRLAGLDPDSKKHVSKYSLGMKQRLGIAQAIMENPSVLLLDEPMNGLDDQGVNEIRNLLLDMKKQGKLIIIASHNKEDIEVLCDKIYSLQKGFGLVIKKTHR